MGKGFRGFSTSRGISFGRGFGGGGGSRSSSRSAFSSRSYNSSSYSRGRSYSGASSYSYTAESWNALQANITAKQERDAARLEGRAGSLQYNKDQKQWHEYHGRGEIRPDGGVDFNDQTPDGKHSHTIRDQDFNIRRHRPEGR